MAITNRRNDTMSFARSIPFAVVCLAGLTVQTKVAHAQLCGPAPDGLGCVPLTCSDIPEEQCLGTVFVLGSATGGFRTEACECLNFNVCHLEIREGALVPAGYCPLGEPCTLVGIDTDGDGIDDWFHAACGPPDTGVCCVDIDDGPVTFDTCMILDEVFCVAGGGMFHGANITCDYLEACCFSFAGGGFCADLNPFCCADSGGVPSGPDTTCSDPASVDPCPEICGGIAGIPCSDPAEFCLLPIGGCCCDFQGVCIPVPTECPLVFDPVCGCDGVTYGNACDAAAARMSIDHDGVCRTGACCLPMSPGLPPCVIVTAEACGSEGGTYLGDGTTCPTDSTVPCAPPTGACCFQPPGSVLPVCAELTKPECLATSGDYLGDGTTCPPDPTLACGPSVVACCFPDGSCVDLSFEVCLTEHGMPGPAGSACTVVGGVFDCPIVPTGACCVPDSAGVTSCFVGTLDACLFAGGAYQGDGSECPTDPTQPCAVPCPFSCPPGMECFRGCGTLVSGVECVLFEADSGGRFLLANLGDFSVGDRVHVAGCRDPDCTTVCMEGNGCIVGNTIAPCGTVCGGIAGIPCDDPNEFCKFPTDTCGSADIFGVCTPIPTGCPRVWDPVCGCDGVTYGNECEADAAGMSIAHRGECETGACCADMGGIPTPLPVCFEATPRECDGDRLFFEGVGTTCDSVSEACCLPRGDCAQVGPRCCAGFGGVSQGPGSHCDSSVVSCGAVCGGTDGIPCDNENEFCKRPEGRCCCDALGICTPMEGCTITLWDPVCGCDGVTYGLECLADGAGVSVAHRGECAWTCCDPDTAPPCIEGPFCCADGQWACGDGGGGTTCDAPGRVCEPVCGGSADIPCEDPSTFCRFPVGTCGMGDVFGMCGLAPTGGCPEIYDPVCGCDGVTYSNECEADAARVSIDHPGECGTGDCPAKRSLGDPNPAYCPGVPKTIRIDLSVPNETTVIALEDSPPAGWTVVAISDDGTYDAVNGKVKWGPFFPPFPPVVSYVVLPAVNEEVSACFEGAISLDGINRPICGDDCLALYCRPLMEADLPQPPCATCPGGGCAGCDASSCSDGRLALCEVIGYACGWKTGCNDDLGGMTRAAFIWRHGECYCYDEVQRNWFPTTCPPPDSGLCAVSNAQTGDNAGVEFAGSATLKAEFRSKRSRRGEVGLAEILIAIHAPEGASAAALDLHLPRGWKVMEMSDGGQWDAQNRKVKWGPFFSDLSRRVTVSARWISEKPSIRNLRSAGVPDLAALSGSVSFDGLVYPILVE